MFLGEKCLSAVNPERKEFSCCKGRNEIQGNSLEDRKEGISLTAVRLVQNVIKMCLCSMLNPQICSCSDISFGLLHVFF